MSEALPKIQRVGFGASPERVELKRVGRVEVACQTSQSACEFPSGILSRLWEQELCGSI